jgi:hypothetical protein
VEPFENYITTEEAAEILDLTPAAIRHRARKGDFGAVKRAGIWWVERNAVEEYKRKVSGKSRFDPTRGRRD